MGAEGLAGYALIKTEEPIEKESAFRNNRIKKAGRVAKQDKMKVRTSGHPGRIGHSSFCVKIKVNYMSGMVNWYLR